MTSGLRAEYNDVYFSSQAFELVSKAIRSIRERELQKIMKFRVEGTQIKGVSAYTLEAAIADVMRYHTTCNVMAGLEEAADAVTRERDPGIVRVNQLLQNAGAGTTISLGTSVIDTSALPSATASCMQLATVVMEGAKVAGSFNKAYAALLASDPDKAAALNPRKVEVDSLLVELNSWNDSVKGDCVGSPPVSVEKETKMFEQVRIFSTLTQSEKAAGKASFDAARADVFALKIKIDSALSSVRGKLDLIIQNSASIR